MAYKICYDNDCIAVKNAEELRVALELTPFEAHITLLEQIGVGITELVKNDSEFLLILRKVMGTKGESKKGYLSLFGNKLGDVITEGETLARALAILANEEDQAYLLNTLKQEGIRDCISNFYDILDCLEWLFGKMDKLFIDLIGWNFVIKHIHTGESLGLILKFLGEVEERDLLAKMGWDRVFECIQTARDFSYVLIGMEVENERTLIENMSAEKLKQVLPFKSNLDKLSKHLTVEDAKLIRGKYKD